MIPYVCYKKEREKTQLYQFLSNIILVLYFFLRSFFSCAINVACFTLQERSITLKKI